jgi:hypothetical protein
MYHYVSSGIQRSYQTARLVQAGTRWMSFNSRSNATTGRQAFPFPDHIKSPTPSQIFHLPPTASPSEIKSRCELPLTLRCCHVAYQDQIQTMSWYDPTTPTALLVALSPAQLRMPASRPLPTHTRYSPANANSDVVPLPPRRQWNSREEEQLTVQLMRLDDHTPGEGTSGGDSNTPTAKSIGPNITRETRRGIRRFMSQFRSW